LDVLMIATLDHTTLLVRDLDSAVANYRQILAREPVSRTRGDGLGCAIFTLGTAALRIVAPKETGTPAERARAQLDERGEGLFDLAFRVNDVARAYRRLRRLSLSPDELSDVAETQDGKRTGLPLDNSGGIPISFLDGEQLASSTQTSSSAFASIDLVVVATINPERAMALYGARLGLPLIFDQVNVANGSRLMQFQCGDMLIEVVHRPATEDKAGRDDRLWGIGWRVADAEAARERLARTGLDVSDVKDGAKRGTRVFTIRNGTCNIPTLVVQHLKDAS
jgi:catechol 2,3-dioxygenase-like lactoylglutathione lyase family enzyme